MDEYRDARPRKRSIALVIWLSCITALIGPSLIVWGFRGAAYAASCKPGPDPCRGFPFGEGLRDALLVAWALPTNTTLMLFIAVAATIAGFFVRRPLLAATGMLILPVAALLLPMLAVFTSVYAGCNVNEAGVGECVLWGAKMGMSFHTAATVSGIVYDFAPYSFALALMLGLLGWFFTLPRPARPHAMARMRRLDDR